MKAIRWNSSKARYALTYAMGRIKKDTFYRGPLATTCMEEIPEPELVNESRVKVKVDHLLTRVWELEEFIKMIETATGKGDTSCIKQAFRF